jgi:hypothetical protein
MQISAGYEKALVQAIRKSSKFKLEAVEVESLAHFVLDSFRRALETTDPKKNIDLLFKRLKTGWGI